MNSNNIAVIIGQRLRTRRLQLGYSQNLTSEKADLHPTYVGQVERGEKNATVESIEKLCRALELPMEELFANIVTATPSCHAAQQSYDLIISQPTKDQEEIFCIIKEIIRYKNE